MKDKKKEQVFSGCTVPPDSKETTLEKSDLEDFPSAGKSAGGEFQSKVVHRSVSRQMFPVVWIFSRFLDVIYYK